MKNLHFERRLRVMRAYHANKRGSQFDAGVRVFHRYDEMAADALSWWDDCQIIVNRRRVMIWWAHPRFRYRNAIEDAAWAAVGAPPPGDRLADMRSHPVLKKAGKSRKRIVAYESGPRDAAWDDYYARLAAAEDRIAAEGIDFAVPPTLTRRTLDWCTGLELCIPVEVRNVAELKALAEIGRRLLKGEATLDELFPRYRYDRKDWLAEQERCEPGRLFSQEVLSMPLVRGLAG